MRAFQQLDKMLGSNIAFLYKQSYFGIAYVPKYVYIYIVPVTR